MRISGERRARARSAPAGHVPVSETRTWPFGPKAACAGGFVYPNAGERVTSPAPGHGRRRQGRASARLRPRNSSETERPAAFSAATSRSAPAEASRRQATRGEKGVQLVERPHLVVENRVVDLPGAH